MADAIEAHLNTCVQESNGNCEPFGWVSRVSATETLPLSVAIDRAMAASDKATQGLWHLDTDCPGLCCYHIFKSEDGIYGPGEDGLINAPEMSKEDAAFIVAAVNLLRTHGQEIRTYASCSLPMKGDHA